ncbi:hypothetical protein TPAU25S_00667 [Tsukamurella paurometabola]
MTATSAGLLLYRIIGTGEPEVLIGHMGGPFWSRKDRHGWSIPKGLYTDEEPLAAAEREFAEELGSPAPSGPTVPLGSVRQSSGKTVTVFARQGDFDADHISSNEFDIEWPRGIWPDAQLPGSRPGRVVQPRPGGREAGEGAGSVPGSVARTPERIAQTTTTHTSDAAAAAQATVFQPTIALAEPVASTPAIVTPSDEPM